MPNQATLHIPLSHVPYLKDINTALMKKSDDYIVTFLLDSENDCCQIIGGHDSRRYLALHFPLSDTLNTRHPIGDFAIPGSVFTDWLETAIDRQRRTLEPFLFIGLNNHPSFQTPHLVFYDLKALSLPTNVDHCVNAERVQIILDNSCRRELQTDLPFERHVEFYQQDNQRQYQQVSKQSCEQLCYEAEHYIPLEMIEFDPDGNTLKVMRDGNIEIKKTQLPCRLDKPLISTQEGLELLAIAAETTSDAFISIVQESEQLIIKTSDMHAAISLESIHQFKRLMEEAINHIVQFTIDFLPFKTELAILRKNSMLHQDTAMLVIQQPQSYVVALDHDKNESHIKPIIIDNLSKHFQEQYIVQINLKEFQHLKVKDITTMRQVRVSLYQRANSREHHLGFYKDSSHKEPDQSLPVLIISDRKVQDLVKKTIHETENDPNKCVTKPLQQHTNFSLDLDVDLGDVDLDESF
ncbi:hypothetical protein L0B53_16180 [Vibrio sp. SS-MA-C1-2]|uniref:hypothetical protein n=1 Tax=Vibrio sp. SS-MA-C1-2 TaxID=2908646 RepID=UPI001F20A588|nr:hypothetical protein [Vibrio sp. SS-MA-C1-2]UJF18538.1 hypothetical protein L0B53_16180 [Vibrio sp. SS-MA-C1-2]